MQLSSLRPVLQLCACLALAHNLQSSASLPATGFLAIAWYAAVNVFIIIPFYLFVYPIYLSPLRHIPSPPPGHNTWRTWLGQEPTPLQLLAWVNATAKENGNAYRGVMRYRGIGGGERLLVSSPETMREVLVTKQYESFDRLTMARKRIAIQAGNGLIASAGDVHKNQKRKLMPAFSPRAIKDLYPLFWAKANELVAALHKHLDASNDSAVSIISWTSRSALDIIGVAAWGRDFDAISKPESPFLKAYSGMFDISGGGPLANALALALPMQVVLQIPLPYTKRLRAALSAIKSRCADTVREKKRAGTEAKESGKDILSLLMRGGVEDEEALVNQMMTMLAAGHDTSSLTLAWACYLMCKHPQVQTRLREELRSQLPLGAEGATREIDPATLEGLHYLGAVASEVLRLMPVVHLTRREATKDTTIGGYPVPVGSHIVASGWVANHMESEWGPTASEFVPERWLPAEDGNRECDRTGVDNKFAFHTFSHGARSCIGQGFARGEFLVFLSAIVGCFALELEKPDEEPTTLFGITMSPAADIKIKLRAIK